MVIGRSEILTFAMVDSTLSRFTFLTHMGDGRNIRRGHIYHGIELTIVVTHSSRNCSFKANVQWKSKIGIGNTLMACVPRTSRSSISFVQNPSWTMNKFGCNASHGVS